MDNKDTKKHFASLFFSTSNAFLKNFLSDTAEGELQRQISQEMAENLQIAAKEKRAVVLQVYNPLLDRLEIHSGWILSKKLNVDQLLIKLKGDEERLKLIPTRNILRVSIWGKEGIKR